MIERADIERTIERQAARQSLTLQRIDIFMDQRELCLLSSGMDPTLVRYMMRIERNYAQATYLLPGKNQSI